jgi:SAM-dependent methyltransferase
MDDTDDFLDPPDPSLDIVVARLFGAVWRGARVLEFGCGKGDDALFLAQAGCVVTAYDSSQVLISYAKARCEAIGASPKEMKCRFVRGDHRAVMRLAEKGRVFDLVSDRLGSSNMKRKDHLAEYFGAVARLLRKGGLFFLRAGLEEGPDALWERVDDITLDRKLMDPLQRFFEPAVLLNGTSADGISGSWLPMVPYRGGNRVTAAAFLLRARDREMTPPTRAS